jgi:hypothetical protein
MVRSRSTRDVFGFDFGSSLHVMPTRSWSFESLVEGGRDEEEEEEEEAEEAEEAEEEEVLSRCIDSMHILSPFHILIAEYFGCTGGIPLRNTFSQTS